MCGGGGGFLGAVSNVVDTVVETVTQPVENIITAGEKLVTDPTKLNLGDAVSLALPVSGGIVRDEIENPDHALVHAAVVGGGLALNATAAAPTIAGAAAPGSILPPAAEIVATPIGASLVPASAAVAAAAPVAASAAGGGGFLATLGATSLAQTLTGIGQKTQSFVSSIPGVSKVLSEIPGLSSLVPGVGSANAAELPVGASVALGPYDAAPTPAPSSQLRSAAVGAAVLAIPLGGVAYLLYRAYKRKA